MRLNFKDSIYGAVINSKSSLTLFFRVGVPGGGTRGPEAGPPPGQHEELREAVEGELGPQSPHATQERLQLVDGD